jgi:hypothetical protein
LQKTKIKEIKEDIEVASESGESAKSRSRSSTSEAAYGFSKK